MNKKLIVANWKMSPSSLPEAEQILDSVDEFLGSVEGEKFSLVFCPPFVFTEEVGKMLKTSHLLHQSELGAQDIFWEDTGADTGEISGPMLRKIGVRYVIVGHSERRWKLGESDETVNKKLKAALRNEFIPIVAVGERTRQISAPQNLGGQARDWKDFLRQQTETTFAGLTADEVARCVIAYEPVWAISSNPDAKPDTPESALESIRVIKDTLSSRYSLFAIRYLYGGSITSANAREFLSNDGFDGVLVGGASVDKEEFVKILSVASQIERNQ